MLHIKRTRRKNKNKARAQAIHTRKRAKQRFDINLNVDNIIEEIQANELEFLCRASNTVSLWLKDYDDVKMVIIYDGRKKTIKTVIPYHWFLARGGVKAYEKDKNQEEDKTYWAREHAKLARANKNKNQRMEEKP